MSEIIERVDKSVKDNFTFLYQGSGSDSWKNAWFAQYGKVVIFSAFATSMEQLKNTLKSFLENVDLADGSWQTSFLIDDSNNKVHAGYLCGGSTWAELWINKNAIGLTTDNYMIYRFNKSGNTVSVQDNLSGSGFSSSQTITISTFVLYTK